VTASVYASPARHTRQAAKARVNAADEHPGIRAAIPRKSARSKTAEAGRLAAECDRRPTPRRTRCAVARSPERGPILSRFCRDLVCLDPSPRIRRCKALYGHRQMTSRRSMPVATLWQDLDRNHSTLRRPERLPRSRWYRRY